MWEKMQEAEQRALAVLDRAETREVSGRERILTAK